MSVYKMAIGNIVRAIRSQSEEDRSIDGNINAFEASRYLGLAFCKSPEEVITDIVSCDYDILANRKSILENV